MAKKQVFVIQSSLHPRVTIHNKAAGNPARIRRRFATGGTFYSCVKRRIVLTGGELVTVYRTAYGFTGNKLAWYDWYEA